MRLSSSQGPVWNGESKEFPKVPGQRVPKPAARDGKPFSMPELPEFLSVIPGIFSPSPLPNARFPLGMEEKEKREEEKEDREWIPAFPPRIPGWKLREEQHPGSCERSPCSALPMDAESPKFPPAHRKMPELLHVRGLWLMPSLGCSEPLCRAWNAQMGGIPESQAELSPAAFPNFSATSPIPLLHRFWEW